MTSLPNLYLLMCINPFIPYVGIMHVLADVDRLQGDWVLEYRISEGQRYDNPNDIVEVYSFAGNNVKLTVDGPEGIPRRIDRFKMKYTSFLMPKSLAFSFPGGAPFPAIYRFRRNKLEMVWNMAGSTIPTKFKGYRTDDLNDNFVLMTLHRVKKND